MIRTCKFDGCERKHYGKGYCNKHYMQLWMNGVLRKIDRSTPNEVTIENDICKIKLYNKKGNTINEAIIDAEDAEKVRHRRWHLTHGYVSTHEASNKRIRLHHLVLGYPTDGKLVDHKNCNKLDNRKQNLRFCTKSENAMNAISHKGSSSKFKGVCWYKDRGKWIVSIRRNGKQYHLGYFLSEIKAAKAYDKAATNLFGRFAKLNFQAAGQME